jgi:hypothetical protein
MITLIPYTYFVTEHPIGQEGIGNDDWNFDIQWSELDAYNQLIPRKVVVKHNGKK